MSFLAAFGTIVFILLVVAILAQLPIYVWTIVILIFILTGIFKNAK